MITEDTDMSLTQEDIQALADMVFQQLNEANRQLMKYTQIVTDYILKPGYIHEGCSLTQAENCVKLYASKVEAYNSLFTKLKYAGADSVP